MSEREQVTPASHRDEAERVMRDALLRMSAEQKLEVAHGLGEAQAALCPGDGALVRPIQARG